MANVHTFTDRTDRDLLEELEPLVTLVERLAANRVRVEARRIAAVADLVTIDAAVAEAGAKLRRALARNDGALALPATLTDAAYDKDTAGEITLYLNAAAPAYRAV